MRYLLAVPSAMLLAIAAMLPGAPAAAQQAWNVPVVTVFGSEKCPRDVICVRAPESEKYRIPKQLRGETGLALAERWGDRAQSLEYVGASGIQSCSPVGAGGASGCYRELARAARAEKREKGEVPLVPLDLP